MVLPIYPSLFRQLHWDWGGMFHIKSIFLVSENDQYELDGAKSYFTRVSFYLSKRVVS